MHKFKTKSLHTSKLEKEEARPKRIKTVWHIGVEGSGQRKRYLKSLKTK